MNNNEIKLSFFEKIAHSYIQHYNHDKYWRIRDKIINSNNTLWEKMINYFRLIYIKRSDAFNNGTTGTHLGFGAKFSSSPNLPHGLYGIVISHNAIIGKNATIFHQVTIGEGKDGAPEIGENCYIGAGAKIFGGIKIGNNVRIGANCVVNEDVPDNTTIKMSKQEMYVRNK